MGGIQIYRFLQRDCPFTVHPLFMSERILKQFGETDWEHPERYRQRANALIQNDSYSQWNVLLATMAKTGLRMEQEAIPDQFVQDVFISESVNHGGGSGVI
ncbi:hypothetical protein D3C78_1517600 [compost metagenome]